MKSYKEWIEQEKKSKQMTYEEQLKQYEKDKKAFENKWSSNWIKKDILNTNKETK